MMFDWEQDAAAWARQGDQEEADARREANDFVTARRRDLELAYTAEMRERVESRGGGPATTHDVALATAAIAHRFGYHVDHAEVEEALSRDPEPVDDWGQPIRPDRASRASSLPSETV